MILITKLFKREGRKRDGRTDGLTWLGRKRDGRTDERTVKMGTD